MIYASMLPVPTRVPARTTRSHLLQYHIVQESLLHSDTEKPFGHRMGVLVPTCWEQYAFCFFFFFRERETKRTPGGGFYSYLHIK